MSTEIHGHEVISLLLANPRSFTRDSLVAFISERFGSTARFHTCSAAGLSAAELVDFLDARGKFAPTEDGFMLNLNRVCRH